jgi:hypothetical protein
MPYYGTEGGEENGAVEDPQLALAFAGLAVTFYAEEDRWYDAHACGPAWTSF